MNLLIIGAGQYGMVVREIAQATGRFDKIDFLDDNNAVAIDSTNNISKWVSEYKIAIVAIGKADVREKYLTLLKQCGYELATIIHPDAYISPTATIGSGCVIEPKAVIHTDVKIGDGCFISAGAVVNHNSVLEDTCHINCGAIIASGVIVPKGIKVDYGLVFTGEK